MAAENFTQEEIAVCKQVQDMITSGIMLGSLAFYKTRLDNKIEYIAIGTQLPGETINMIPLALVVTPEIRDRLYALDNNNEWNLPTYG